MEYSYKFQLYPNRRQETQMGFAHLGCCRFVFNHYLAYRKDLYEQSGENCKLLCVWNRPDRSEKQEETSWLREVDATALQSSLRDLDDAYQNFFRRIKHGKARFPRFKSKHDHRQSYKSKCVGTNIKVLDKAIQLPKLGAVKCRISKEVKGRILLLRYPVIKR